MKNFKNQLVKRSGELSELENKILEFLLDNLQVINDLSIEDIAQELYVSTASISRTTKKLGFEGYREFKFFVNQTIETNDYMFDIKRKEANELLYKKHLHEEIENVFKHIDRERIITAANMIHQANSIEIISMGASTSAGNDLSYKLLTLNKKAAARIDWDELEIISKNLNPNDLAILISLSGETKGILNYAKNLVSNRTPVLSIVGTKNSTLEKITKNTIIAVSKPNYIGKIDMSSRVPMLIIIDYILDIYSKLYLTESSHNKM
ncbi:MurR/RpiR family transcriptional regulator [Facklamia miroungae]|uniref:DNA-binding transcriptional regulator, MurR/RpiR family, contains HTH and SIS domains n=1 Tax=Facklamia miroungae TaxID=120956 RepID=A0A1G7UEN7_9LACT|nr:MurR/RpiR family transcriptional regulator [Facklamia miroungae]NKZ30058.1 MurR/RpiR family transcriptional regulator [Facklamia miroungae]SDG45240.1 DNA-binding transcriptional regulator, MurR/RpiR family, contains HTH and SIS domains [Facklamia miroungae]